MAKAGDIKLSPERMHRRHLTGAADVFAGVRATRKRFDPRRLADRSHERACRRWLAAFPAPGGNR